jgi:septal ring factor EnvC (AmiA/AmiB activator)
LQINFDNDTSTEHIKELISNYKIVNIADVTDLLSEKVQFDVIHMLTSDDLCYTDKEKKLLYWCKAFQAKTAKELLEVLEEHELMEEKATEKFLGEVDKYSTNDEVYQIYTEYSREEMERNTANINLELKRQEVEQKQQEVKQYEQEVKNREQEVKKHEENIKSHEQDVVKREQDVEAKSKELDAKNKELDKAKDNLVNQGKKENQIEIAKNLLLMDMDIDDISKATRLSIEEIENLK